MKKLLLIALVITGTTSAMQRTKPKAVNTTENQQEQLSQHLPARAMISGRLGTILALLHFANNNLIENREVFLAGQTVIGLTELLGAYLAHTINERELPLEQQSRLRMIQVVYYILLITNFRATFNSLYYGI